MAERAEGLQKVAAPGAAPPLAPEAPIGMAVGAEIAPAPPAPPGPVRVRATVRCGGYLAAAPPRGHAAWWRRGRGVRAGSGGVLTGVAVWLFDKAFKGVGRTVTLWLGGGEG